MSNLERTRHTTLNVFAGLFLLSTGILFFVRLAQSAWLHALVDLIAVAVVLLSVWMARVGRFNLAVWLLSLPPPLLAFALIEMGKFRDTLMLPQIAMSMLTVLLIFSRQSSRIVFLVIILILIAISSYTGPAELGPLIVLLVQTILFALIFICYVLFFERQDATLNRSIELLARSNRDRQTANDRLSRVNLALHDSNAQLNERVEELLVFSHIMSHDLKGPLCAIMGHAELLGHDIDENPGSKEVRESIELINIAAVNMTTLINDLLMYAKVASSAQQIEEVDLNQVLCVAEEQLAYQIKKHGTKIIRDPLPKVYGNPDLFRTVLYNLMSNAIKYQPVDEPDHIPRLEFTSKLKGGWVHLFIKDNGIGISPEYLPQLFTPFKRDRAENYQGTGLGMSICRRIMEKFNGDIQVKETSSAGTTCQLTFPATSELACK